MLALCLPWFEHRAVSVANLCCLACPRAKDVFHVKDLWVIVPDRWVCSKANLGGRRVAGQREVPVLAQDVVVLA